MKKIRLKFIFISAIILFVVLFAIISSLNISNFNNVYNTNSETIQKIHNLDATEKPFPDLPSFDDPETRFKARFFVSTYEDGHLSSIDITNVARINEEEATEISNDVFTSGSLEGKTKYYQYKGVVNDNIVKYVFLDVEESFTFANQVLLLSSTISLGGYLVVLLLIIIFSKIVIKPLELADAKQKRFITDASHELKTPLTVINSNLEIIEMEQGNSEWIDSSKKQIENLTSMTNQLVLLSRLNEYDSKIVISSININETLENSLMAYLPLLQNKNINLKMIKEEDVILDTDGNILSQIFNILLDNMLKYALEGEASIEIEKTRNGANILFKNKFDPSINLDVTSMFDRFYRGDASRGNSKGFGIGLSLAKSLVTLLKGKIIASIQQDTITFKIVL